jgi:hypothetical protein
MRNYHYWFLCKGYWKSTWSPLSLEIRLAKFQDNAESNGFDTYWFRRAFPARSSPFYVLLQCLHLLEGLWTFVMSAVAHEEAILILGQCHFPFWKQ